MKKNRYNIDEVELENTLYNYEIDYSWPQLNPDRPIAFLLSDNSRITGFVSTFYQSGQIKEEMYFKVGLLHGSWQEWYENGKLKFIGFLNHGKAEGLWQGWYENGQLIAKETYKNGKREGLWQEWYENGNLFTENNFYNNERTGISRSWYENGQIEEKAVFEENFMSFSCWYENGNLNTIGAWDYFDRKVGVWSKFDENGNLKSKTDYGFPEPMSDVDYLIYVLGKRKE
jgi:antitoxin component YwqK of YwqJK toxin-antitoxin module